MVEFVVNDEMVKEVMPSRERVIEVLESVGFVGERQVMPVAELSGELAHTVHAPLFGASMQPLVVLDCSCLLPPDDNSLPTHCSARHFAHLSARCLCPAGGWKMKLALARAMLMNADIMLLDEPTNHLDTTNVAWLIDYLVGLKGVTSVVVSHDSGFLDSVCSSIIHYEDNFKLKKYLGNLSKFVQQRPEAAAYYNLADASTKWVLPEPGYLEVRRG